MYNRICSALQRGTEKINQATFWVGNLHIANLDTKKWISRRYTEQPQKQEYNTYCIVKSYSPKTSACCSIKKIEHCLTACITELQIWPLKLKHFDLQCYLELRVYATCQCAPNHQTQWRVCWLFWRCSDWDAFFVLLSLPKKGLKLVFVTCQQESQSIPLLDCYIRDDKVSS